MLRHSREDAIALAYKKGVKESQTMLRRAESELMDRLRTIQVRGDLEEGSFTQTQIRATLAQIRATLKPLEDGLKGVVLSAGEESADHAAVDAVKYMKAAQAKYRGINQPLAIREASVLDRALQGTKSSILHRLLGEGKDAGVLNRYGDAVVGRFEKRLQQRFLQKKPWADVRNELIADSPFLQQAPAHWAERIVRTEVMGAHNRSGWEAMRAADQELGGGMLKILSATFDARTGSDSYAVHGQIRRVAEAFTDWRHNYQHPPNRPNDREVVVPHNIAWPIPNELRWRTDSEVASAWRAEGRKGSPPRRPQMTTVLLNKIGNG